jgi:hypothetical protein
MFRHEPDKIQNQGNSANQEDKRHGCKSGDCSKINQLESYPDAPVRVSRYKTTNLLKFRVKSWRVFFTAELEIIEIQEVKKRNERTYK